MHPLVIMSIPLLRRLRLNVRPVIQMTKSANHPAYPLLLVPSLIQPAVTLVQAIQQLYNYRR
jgi:hypothetical protein